jgi:hypothetical protein
MIFSQPAHPPSVPPVSSPLQAASDQGRATQHGRGSTPLRAFSFQSSNDALANLADCHWSPRSSRWWQATAGALGTLKPSPLRSPSLIQINHVAHGLVSSFVADRNTNKEICHGDGKVAHE